MARDITKLHPKAQEKANALVAECKKQGLIISITSCVRDAEEQLDCYKRKTSSLKYPFSMHNWGVAFDFCRNDGKGAYYDKDGFFSKVGAIGKKLGLIWGGDWTKPDKPHFQLSDWGTGTSTLRSKYGSPEKFMATWKTSQSTGTSTTVSTESKEDSEFKAWVKKVQKALGVTADGIVGSKTINATITVSAKKNNKHAVVKLLQERLNKLGFDCGKADGIAGTKFDLATKKFQKSIKSVQDGEFTAKKTAWKTILKYNK